MIRLLRITSATLIGVLVLHTAAPAFAQVRLPLRPALFAQDPAAPAAAGEELKIVITAVKGMVEVRTAEDQPWQKAAVGMELKIGYDIRTGLRSVCQFTINVTHLVTLDRLGTVKVLDARKTESGVIKTDVGMKYGRTEYKVEAAGEEHESRVHAPSATLAVRGSEAIVEDDDAFGGRIYVIESQSAQVTQRAPVGGPAVIPVTAGRVNPGQTNATPAQVALDNASLDPGGRLARASQVEQQLIASLPLQIGQDLGVNVPTRDFRAQEVANETQDGIGQSLIIDGGLRVTLTWQGQADLDLFGRDPFGDIVSTFVDPNLNGRPSIPSGAVAGPDDLGPNGTEFYQWSANHPAGSHAAGLTFFPFTGATAANFNITVVQSPVGQAPRVLHNVSGTVDINNPTFVTEFTVPLPMTTPSASMQP